MRELLYNTKFKRVVMRFVEIFVLAGLSAVIFSSEFETQVVAVFGTAIAATILKFVRELTSE